MSTRVSSGHSWIRVECTHHAGLVVRGVVVDLKSSRRNFLRFTSTVHFDSPTSSGSAFTVLVR